MVRKSISALSNHRYSLQTNLYYFYKTSMFLNIKMQSDHGNGGCWVWVNILCSRGVADKDDHEMVP